MIKQSSLAKEELERLDVRATHKTKKCYYKKNIFEHGELRVTSFNINGIKDRNHIDLLKNDKNLMYSDVIAIQESKCTEIDLSEQLTIPGFHLIYRRDNTKDKKKMGMLLYAKHAENFNITTISHNSTSEYEFIKCNINFSGRNSKIYFIYVHPKATSEEYDNLAQNIKASDIIIGDLNIDTINGGKSKRKKLQKFLRSTETKSVLKEKTHRDGGQLDNCLIQSEFPSNQIYVTSFASLYSDHHAIDLRIALDEQDQVKVSPKVLPPDELWATDDEDDITETESENESNELPSTKIPLISDEHMSRITNNQWLLDEIIDAYLNLVVQESQTQKIQKTWAFTTKFYTNLMQSECHNHEQRHKFKYENIKSW